MTTPLIASAIQKGMVEVKHILSLDQSQNANESLILVRSILGAIDFEFFIFLLVV